MNILLADEYRQACIISSDINEHLPFLYQLASDCDSIIEFGVRYGMSTRAFLYSGTSLKSYDLELNPEIENLFVYAKQNGMDVDYIKASTLDIDIEFVDLLFIDTLHTYDQLSKELKLHGNKANKYIVFHDTYSYGLKGEDGGKGLLQAIIEFIIENPHWKIKYHFTNNNGLTVLENSNLIKEKWTNTQYPTLEITTSIPKKGCIVNCNFCPQNTLISKYSDNIQLSLNNFKLLLNKVPNSIRIAFAGFTEPWLNSNTTEMVLYAHSKGHPIAVFTTGIGMSIEDMNKIKNIPFYGYPNGGFILHVPDNGNNAKHPITSKYIKLLEYISSISHEISNFEVVSMGYIHDSINHLFPNYKMYEMYTRAGNLLGEFSLKPELTTYPFKIYNYGTQNTTCNCAEKLYHNVLLPNGDVSLCCMDYSLKHILGNLYEQNYNDIIPKNNTCFELCRHCENGIVL